MLLDRNLCSSPDVIAKYAAKREFNIQAKIKTIVLLKTSLIRPGPTSFLSLLKVMGMVRWHLSERVTSENLFLDLHNDKLVL